MIKYTPSKISISITAILFACFLSIGPRSVLAINGPQTVSIQNQRNSTATVEIETLSKKEHRQLVRKTMKSTKKSFFKTLRGPSDPDQVNGFAVAGFVCGLVGLLAGGIILGALGIIFSAVALKRIREFRGGSRGKGLAIAGLVLGIVAFAASIVILAV